MQVDNCYCEKYPNGCQSKTCLLIKAQINEPEFSGIGYETSTVGVEPFVGEFSYE